MTTPTPIAKSALEYIAKMRMIDKEEILEHKHYYTNQEMQILMKQSGFYIVGINDFVLA